MAKKYSAPAYPRILVSAKRHKLLAQEAMAKGININQLVEERFVKTDPKK